MTYDELCQMLIAIKQECGLDKPYDYNESTSTPLSRGRDKPLSRKGQGQSYRKYAPWENDPAKKYVPLPGEIHIKSYIIDLMKKRGIGYSGAWRRIRDGSDNITVRRLSKNEQYVSFNK
jgi:hypothetical protein